MIVVKLGYVTIVALRLGLGLGLGFVLWFVLFVLGFLGVGLGLGLGLGLGFGLRVEPSIRCNAVEHSIRCNAKVSVAVSPDGAQLNAKSHSDSLSTDMEMRASV